MRIKLFFELAKIKEKTWNPSREKSFQYSHDLVNLLLLMINQTRRNCSLGLIKYKKLLVLFSFSEPHASRTRTISSLSVI